VKSFEVFFAHGAQKMLGWFGGFGFHGTMMNWYGQQKGEGFEYHLLAIAMGLVILIKGAGALSVDHALSGAGE